MSKKRDEIMAAELRALGVTNFYTAGRSVLVQIANATKSLDFISPRSYLYSGYCVTPLDPDVRPGANDSAVFAKTPYSLKGTVGVLTWDLRGIVNSPNVKLALMFSLPFNFNFYDNWYAVGVFGSNTDCDYNLYHEMYYKDSSSFVRGKAKDTPNLIYKFAQYVIVASMTDSYNSKIELRVEETI